MNPWKSFLGFMGYKPCIACGKPEMITWERTRTISRSTFSTKQGEKKLNLKAVVDCRGLCSACLQPRVDQVMKKVDEAFADLLPETMRKGA